MKTNATSFEKSYWNNKGRYQALGDELHKLIPSSGEVPNKKVNRALEKYRKACNCYYDLFNNGLCNRTAEFRSVFGFSPKRQYQQYYRGHCEIDFQNEEMNARLNAAVDEMILAACREQGIEVASAVADAQVAEVCEVLGGAL